MSGCLAVNFTCDDIDFYPSELFYSEVSFLSHSILWLTEFPTSKLEMETVADIFDRRGGYIDYQEFIAALRPDWEKKGPLTDAERIDDEVHRQVNECTCRQKFLVHQVGEGKYRVSSCGIFW